MKKRIVIVIAHNKGGVGKSTVSMNLAYAFKKSGYNPALLDRDSQGTTYASSQSVKAYTVGEEIPADIDILIVDTPPYLTSDYLELFQSADLVLIPTRPNPADVIEIPKTLSIFNQAKYKNPKLKGYILINHNDKRTGMLGLVMEQIKTYDIPILDTMLDQRVSYARSLFDDEGVFTENDKEAHREMLALKDEILSLL